MYAPFQTNLTDREFFPTRSFELLDQLMRCLPNHQIIASDFHYLPDAIDGISGPVVQTRYQNEMVACSTFLVQPGYFDIFFPTNFTLLSKIYRELTGNDSFVSSHKDFVTKYGDLDATATQSGENPMVQYYENVSFLIGR